MIHFPEDIVLEDNRVMLRPLQQKDLDHLLSFAEEEPELWSYSAVSAAGKHGMTAYLEFAISQRNLQIEYPFIVFDKQSNEWAGSSRFYDIQLGYLTTQLGYTWYGGKFQRTGLNRHCKLLLLSYAFEDWGMERVEFRADLRNERSVNAMKNIGCTIEGVLRSNMPLANGGRRDSIVLSILKKEWYDSVKNNLLAKTH
jgi:RimJ/RimL family protein N-acetyltransferase